MLQSTLLPTAADILLTRDTRLRNHVITAEAVDQITEFLKALTDPASGIADGIGKMQAHLTRTPVEALANLPDLEDPAAVRRSTVGEGRTPAPAAAPAAAEPVAVFSDIRYQAIDPPQAAEGHYRNPVLPGFHPDPAVLRVGEDFYLVTSTFGWFPALPVYHSRDLVNWKLIGHAVDRPGMLDLAGLSIVGDGVYAPGLEYHNGKFYLFNTCVRCGGNFFVTATDPAGPWSDPVWLELGGIDPARFVDDDGSTWALNNDEPRGGSRYEGHRALWIQRIDLETGAMVGPRTQLVDGGVKPEENPIWPEGPHIYKVDGWYYLNAAEGGTAEGHAQTIYRSGFTVYTTLEPVLQDEAQRLVTEQVASLVEHNAHNGALVAIRSTIFSSSTPKNCSVIPKSSPMACMVVPDPRDGDQRAGRGGARGRGGKLSGVLGADVGAYRRRGTGRRPVSPAGPAAAIRRSRGPGRGGSAAGQSRRCGQARHHHLRRYRAFLQQLPLA